MTPRPAGLLLSVAVTLTLWVLCDPPGSGFDGRTAFAVVLALLAVLIPPRRTTP